jgi:Protein of unknown function (DUF3732)
MQITNILLYGKNGKMRNLSFNIGKVNIITGDSKTGKTAIIDIVDYCLGSSEFKVAEGVVKEHVFWYAVKFQLKQGQLLIARPNPIKNKRSASDVYFLQADNIEIPKFEELISNINVDVLVSKLTNIIGIEEYKHQVDNFSRPATPVSFKHSRYYCFQPQTDIDQRDFLFYHQTKEDGRIAQAMKDTLPYFLGAIESETIQLERQLADKRRTRNRLEREVKDAQSVIEKSLGQVFELLNEAKQVGLISFDTIAENREIGLNILTEIAQKDDIDDMPNIENELLLNLQEDLNFLTQIRSSINNDIKAAENYEKERRNYTGETQHQILRLESVNIFTANNDIDNSVCPLCDNPLLVKIPTIEQITNSLEKIKSNLEVTEKEQPRLRNYLDELQQHKTTINGQIYEIEKSINGIYKEVEQAKKTKDLNIRKGRVLGRISLYLESKVEAGDFSTTKQRINELEIEIEQLQHLLSSEEKDDRLENALDQISVQMTNWAKELELEFKERKIKFDVKKLTLFIISEDRTIKFDQTGSGENWVSYHLLIHFALHNYFIKHKRPVPNFLILDQLSQAYFPPEKDIKGTGEIEQSEDDKAIKRLFEFIFAKTAALEGNFQTIIIDHAKLNDSYFKDAIIEEWRNGIKLVPVEWTIDDE